MTPPRPINLGRGTSDPIALRRIAGFVGSFTTPTGIGSRIALRSLAFGRHLSALGGHHAFPVPEFSFDLRRRFQRQPIRERIDRRIASWPAWPAPPAIAIQSRHEQFLGVSVLPESPFFDDPAESWDPDPIATFTLGAQPIPTTPLTLGAQLVPTTPLTQGAQLVPKTPLTLHHPRAERQSSTPGLAMMRRIAEPPAPLVTVGALASRVVADHGVPEFGASIPPTGERFLRQAQDQHDDMGGTPAYFRLPENRHPEPAKDLSPIHRQHGRHEAPTSNFTLALLRQATWQPEHPILRQSLGTSASAAPSARPMRVDPVSTPYVTTPIPPSTLSAPAADWTRQSVPSIPAAPTLPSLLPSFVTDRLTHAAQLATPTFLEGNTIPSQPDDPLHSFQFRSGSPQGIVGSAGRPLGDFNPRFQPNQPASPLDLPVVLRRLAFAASHAQRALTGAISPVWGSLARQVVPLPMPTTPAATTTTTSTLPATPQTAAAFAGSFPLPPTSVSTSTSPATPRTATAFAGSFPLPPTSVSWSAPATVSSAFAALPVARAAMSRPAVSPIVYRSPIPDRADPTEIQRSEAAEHMATSTGQSLPTLVRRSMENRLGMDLTAVRVHSGPAVMRASNLLGARAMAHGTDVFLPGGVSESPTGEGMPLLAHELTHVAQHLGHRPMVQPRAPLTLARHHSDEEGAATQIERSVSRDIQRFGLPSLPKMPSMPKMPSIPNMPSLPSMPNMPSVPNMPSLPNMPNMPGMPNMPSSLGEMKDLVLAHAPSQVKQMAGQAGQLVDQAEGALDSAQGAAKNAIGSILGTDSPGAAAPNPAEIAEQVYQLLERRLIVERERGGFRR